MHITNIKSLRITVFLAKNILDTIFYIFRSPHIAWGIPTLHISIMSKQFLNSNFHVTLILPFFLSFTVSTLHFYGFLPWYLPTCPHIPLFPIHLNLFLPCRLMGGMESESQVKRVASCQPLMKVPANSFHSFWKQTHGMGYTCLARIIDQCRAYEQFYSYVMFLLAFYCLCPWFFRLPLVIHVLACLSFYLF